MGVFKRSWELTKITFSVMTKEKELFIFPILSIILSLLFVGALLFPTILIDLFKGESAVLGGLQIALIILAYFGLAFIATFFNVCVVYTAASAFANNEAKFWKTIGFAIKRIHVILLWSLVSATVGLILKMIEGAAKNMKGAGRIVVSILRSMLGLAWSIVTIFVIPGLVYHNLGPFAAIKKSIKVLKKTWGESLVKYLGMTISMMLFWGLGFLIGIPLIILGFFALDMIGLIIALIIVFIYFLSVTLLFGVANQIFDTALYAYAESGVAVPPYTDDLLRNAFKSEKKKGIFLE